MHLETEAWHHQCVVSSVVEFLVDIQKVAGSNPARRTITPPINIAYNLTVEIAMTLISENSFYTDALTKQDFLADHQRVIDAFYLNFFGFTALYSMSHKRKGMSAHAQHSSSTRIALIDDNATDWLLSLKCMFDTGNIPPVIADQLSRFMFLIKSGKIVSTDIKEDGVRKWLDDIHYQIHKPSMKIYRGIEDFHAGKITLPQLGKYLFHASADPKYKPMSKDFRELCKQYTFESAFDTNSVHPVNNRKSGSADTPDDTTSIAPAAKPAPVKVNVSDIIEELLAKITPSNFLEIARSLIGNAHTKEILSDDRMKAKAKECLSGIDISDLEKFFSEYKDEVHALVPAWMFDRMAESKQPLFVLRVMKNAGPISLDIIKNGVELIFKNAMPVVLLNFVKESIEMDLETGLYVLSRGFSRFPITCASKFSQVRVEVYRNYGHDHSRIYAELEGVINKIKESKYGHQEYHDNIDIVKSVVKMFNSFNTQHDRNVLQKFIFDKTADAALNDSERVNMVAGFFVAANPNPTPSIRSMVGVACAKFQNQTAALVIYPVLFTSNYLDAAGYQTLLRGKIVSQFQENKFADAELIKFAAAFRDSTLLAMVTDHKIFDNLHEHAAFIVDAILHDIGKAGANVDTSLAILRRVINTPAVATTDNFKRIATTIVGTHVDLADLKAKLIGFPPAVEDMSFDNMFLSKVAHDIGTAEIGPDKALTHEEIADILRYNNIKLPDLNSTASIDEKYAQYLESTKQLKPLAAKRIELKEEDLEELSIEHDKYNRYKHGQLGIRFLKSFEVNLPGQREGAAEFVKENEAKGINVTTVIPSFHGTGDIAAGMILRYGFAVINSHGAIGVTGRMLGDGIYFSNVLDKVAQYLVNSGFQRGLGQRGYIFEMDAYLGKEQRDTNGHAYDSGPWRPGYDWRSAGLPGRNDGIVSPEWCVKDEKRQLVVKRAFLVEVVDPSYIDAIKGKKAERDKAKANESLDEAFTITDESKAMTHAITYTFMDGTIPVSWTNAIPLDQFDANQHGHPAIDVTAHGPLLTFESDRTESYVVVNTREFMKDHEKLKNFLDLTYRKV